MSEIRECKACGKEFDSKQSTYVYCSPSCRRIADKKRNHEYQLQRCPRERRCIDCQQKFPTKTGPNQRCPSCYRVHLANYRREANRRQSEKRKPEREAARWINCMDCKEKFRRNKGNQKRCFNCQRLHHLRKSAERQGYGTHAYREKRNAQRDAHIAKQAAIELVAILTYLQEKLDHERPDTPE